MLMASMGIAKPTPADVPDCVKMAVLTPMTRPCTCKAYRQQLRISILHPSVLMALSSIVSAGRMFFPAKAAHVVGGRQAIGKCPPVLMNGQNADQKHDTDEKRTEQRAPI